MLDLMNSLYYLIIANFEKSIIHKIYKKIRPQLFTYIKKKSLSFFFRYSCFKISQFRLFNNFNTRVNIAYKKIWSKRKFTIIDKFFVKHQTTAFSFYQISERRKFPWFESISFSRSRDYLFDRKFPTNLYSHKYKPHWMFHTAPRTYRRIKKPYNYKHNRIYQLFKKTFFSFYKPAIDLTKMKRLKHIFKGFFLSFYGHRTLQQYRNIFKRQQFKKSWIYGTTKGLLENLVQRLDVLLYKCNFAPTILASRQIISSHQISINGHVQTNPANLISTYDYIETTQPLLSYIWNLAATKNTLNGFWYRKSTKYNLKLSRKKLPDSTIHLVTKTQPRLQIRYGTVLWRPNKNSELCDTDRISYSRFQTIKLLLTGK